MNQENECSLIDVSKRESRWWGDYGLNSEIKVKGQL